MLTAGDSTGDIRDITEGQHSTATAPPTPSNRGQNPSGKRCEGRQLPSYTRGLFLVLQLILILRGKKVAQLFDGEERERNRKCASIFNRKAALENYCVTASITRDGEE